MLVKTFQDSDARPFQLVGDSLCAAEDSPEVQFDWRDRRQVTASVNVSTVFKADSCAFFGRLEPNLENPPLNIFCMQLIQFSLHPGRLAPHHVILNCGHLPAAVHLSVCLFAPASQLASSRVLCRSAQRPEHRPSTSCFANQ